MVSKRTSYGHETVPVNLDVSNDTKDSQITKVPSLLTPHLLGGRLVDFVGLDPAAYGRN
jgi:hypothetical protein